MTIPDNMRLTAIAPWWAENGITLYHGDNRLILPTLPAESVNCCVTSPPYWGLRQYLFDGASQIRHDISNEKRQEIEAELARRGITPRP